MNGYPRSQRKLRVLLGAAVLIAGMAFGMPVPASAALPAGVTHVAVTAGGTTAGIDAHLHPAASISGTVTSALTGKPLEFVEVGVYLRGRRTALMYSDAAGHYVIGGLSASATGYAVCARWTDRQDAAAPRGYAGRCYRSVAWDDKTVPASATLVPLADAQHKTGINIALRQQAAAITGQVTSPTGTPMVASVSARNRTTGVVYNGSGGTGRYVLRGLPPAPDGYSVCARPNDWETFLPRCWRDVPWRGTGFPAGATPVLVKLGTTHTGINIVVPRAGAVAGMVRDAVTGAAVPTVSVWAFDARGRPLGQDYTDQGGYRIVSLPPSSSYRVCVRPADPSQRIHYRGMCWKNVTWSGGALPAGVTGVSVQAARTHTGINFKLPKVTYRLGTLAGTISDQVTGKPLSARVEVFRTGNRVILSATSDASGRYQLALRPYDTGYVVCATAQPTSGVPKPATGWSPRCYKNATWLGWPQAYDLDEIEPFAPPGTVTRVPLAAGQKRTGIDVVITPGGRITGTATVFGTSTPTGSVGVTLYTAGGGWVAGTTTSAGGTYSIARLAPQTASASTGYTVCFYGGGYNEAGYLNQCYKDIPWSG